MTDQYAKQIVDVLQKIHEELRSIRSQMEVMVNLSRSPKKAAPETD